MNSTKWEITARYLLALIITITFSIIAFFSFNIYLLVKDSFNPNRTLTLTDITYHISTHMNLTSTGIQIDDAYLQPIEANNGWIQVLDENGTELYSRFKPSSIPSHYTPAELIFYDKNAGSLRDTSSNKGYSIFSDMKEIQNRKLTYIVAFPEQKVYRFFLSFNGDALAKDLLTTFLIVLLVAVIVGYLFSLQIVNPVSQIMDSIRKLAQQKYIKPYEETGLFGNVYRSLNLLSRTLDTNEKKQKKLETMRQNWITNITHDVKTPLSSVKGYSELLFDSDYTPTPEERAHYAKIIWNKAAYIEQLTEDLKLTYQLESIPISKQPTNLVEVLREAIIHILNHPSYEHTSIEYEPCQEEILFSCDTLLLQRAFNNLLFNAIVHNPEGTSIHISLKQEDEIILTIADNGKGIPKEELEHLFERYYRGTNTGESHKGSGLGMAIAKQIVETHGGTIHITSELQKGTTITITFPIQG